MLHRILKKPNFIPDDVMSLMSPYVTGSHPRVPLGYPGMTYSMHEKEKKILVTLGHLECPWVTLGYP